MKYVDCFISLISWGLLFCLKWSLWLVALSFNFFEGRGEPFEVSMKLVAGFGGLLYLISLSIGFFLAWPVSVYQVIFGFVLYVSMGMVFCKIIRDTTGVEFQHLIETNNLLEKKDEQTLKDLFWPFFTLNGINAEIIRTFPQLVASVILFLFMCVGIIFLTGVLIAVLKNDWVLAIWFLLIYFLLGIVAKSLKQEVTEGFH